MSKIQMFTLFFLKLSYIIFLILKIDYFMEYNNFQFLT